VRSGFHEAGTSALRSAAPIWSLIRNVIHGHHLPRAHRWETHGGWSKVVQFTVRSIIPTCSNGGYSDHGREPHFGHLLELPRFDSYSMGER
jgi:hypothetical protein